MTLLDVSPWFKPLLRHLETILNIKKIFGIPLSAVLLRKLWKVNKISTKCFSKFYRFYRSWGKLIYVYNIGGVRSWVVILAKGRIRPLLAIQNTLTLISWPSIEDCDVDAVSNDGLLFNWHENFPERLIRRFQTQRTASMWIIL